MLLYNTLFSALHAGDEIFIPQKMKSPADYKFKNGLEGSVAEQVCGATIDVGAREDKNKIGLLDLSEKKNGAQGYFLPYIGKGHHKGNVGVSIDPGRSLGSYTPKLKAGGDISWVCTGRFSGCYQLSVPGRRDRSVVFGHVVTPTSSNSQYTTNDPKNQV